MFERRLKIFLGILLGVMSVLLLRAVHLQIITRSHWARQAEDFRKRPVYVETTRGRILDHNGAEIAVDEACLDACVDYRAISRNEKWIDNLAIRRAEDRLGDQYAKASRAKRDALVAEQADAVKSDIDAMFALLSEVSGKSPEEIDEICRAIDLKVAYRSRYVQYKRFASADAKQENAAPPPWYRRWLIEGGEGGPSIDDFEQEFGEETEAHPIVRNISQAVYMRLAKESPRCPGLVLRQGTTRRYPYGPAGAHLLGMLAPVTREDLLNDPHLDEELRKYDFTDLIGRGGIEALAEPTLRGARGKVFRKGGRDEEVASRPVPGADVKSTIDIELQADFQQMFAHMKVPSHKRGDPRTVEVAMRGAVVVIDVKSAEVRALASYPDYDANLLSTNFTQLASMKEEAPLMNRATQSQLEPGSTIKPVVGISAITQGIQLPGVGVLTPHSGVECTGYLIVGGRPIHDTARCWVAKGYATLLGGKVAHHPIPFEAPHRGTHGNPDGFLTFPDALERSCNVYFETLGNKLGTIGLSWWYDRFGLGRKTGIGIPEARGLLPSRLQTNNPSVAWFSAIGQTGVLATPIQMANVAATIARDGIWMRPRLIEGDVALSPVAPSEGGPIADVADLNLSKAALAAAREGMVRVVNNPPAGTGDNARMAEFIVAGKTGTAQAHRLSDPQLDAEGKPIYVGANGKIVAADEDGWYDQRDADGRIVQNEKGEPVRLKAKPVMVERALATIDQPTQWPWYRGWGEDGSEVSHGWFIGFAPADDPQVALAVMIEYGGSGGLAARVANDVLVKCMEHGYVKVQR